MNMSRIYTWSLELLFFNIEKIIKILDLNFNNRYRLNQYWILTSCMQMSWK
jgi:hypothetical protein